MMRKRCSLRQKTACVKAFYTMRIPGWSEAPVRVDSDEHGWLRGEQALIIPGQGKGQGLKRFIGTAAWRYVRREGFAVRAAILIHGHGIAGGKSGRVIIRCYGNPENMFTNPQSWRRNEEPRIIEFLSADGKQIYFENYLCCMP